MLKQILFVFLLFTIVYAENNPFEVKNITIQTDEGNLQDSQTAALTLATRKAINLVLKKIAVHESQDKIDIILKKIDNPVLYLDTFIVQNERMTSHSYMATYDISLIKDKIKNILNNAGIKYGNKYSDEMLIIPIVSNANESTLNKWLDLIQEHSAIGLLSLQTINNDLFYSKNLVKKDVMTLSFDILEQILDRYHVKSLILLDIHIQNNDILTKIRMIKSQSEYQEQFTFTKNIDENQNEFQIRAVKGILDAIDNLWKTNTMKNYDKLYTSIVQINNVAKINDFKRILNKISVIKDYRYKVISPKLIELEIEYTVTPEKLSQLLLKNGIKVINDKNQIFLEI